MIFSRDSFALSAFVANQQDNTVSIIDTETYVVTGPYTVGSNPEGVTITPDGDYVYVTNQNTTTSPGFIYVIEVANPTNITSFQVGTFPFSAVFSKLGSIVYVVCSGDFNSPGSVYLYDVTTQPPTQIGAPIEVGVGPLIGAITPDGRRLYVGNVSDQNNPLSVIDTATNVVIATIHYHASPNQSGTTGITFTPDGKFAYVANQNDNAVYVIDTVTYQTVQTINVGNRPFGVSITPNGKEVYVVNQSDNSVSVIDTNTNTVSFTIPVGVNPFEVSITPNGRYAYVANQESSLPGNVSVIDTTTHSQLLNIPVGQNPLGIAFAKVLLPPLNLAGDQKRNDFGLEYELYNTLSWEVDTGSAMTAGYYIYRNGVQIAQLDNTTFVYKDRNVNKNVRNQYQIATFGFNGKVSEFSNAITIN